MKRIASFVVVGLITLGACREAPLGTAAGNEEVASLGPQAAAGSSITDARTRKDEDKDKGEDSEQLKTVSVFSQNLYVGADVDAVINALVSSDPADDFPTLLAAIQTFQETDYLARMGAVADEIARARPHAVGLQEVSVLDIDLTGFGLPIVIHADFLPVLMEALDARGLHYRVAATIKNLEATPVPGIRLVDYDALLVDADRVTVRNAGGQNFAVNLGTVAPGVELKRGWVWASTTVDKRPYFFASTHLEGSASGMPELLAAQASELAAFLPDDRPVIVMGDFNDRPGSPMHQAMTSQGFADVWASLHPGDAGFTCCQAPDLSNPTAQFTQRIDYVFARDIGHPQFDVRSSIEIQGDEPADRIAGPNHSLWPSDHGGLLARLSKLRADVR